MNKTITNELAYEALDDLLKKTSIKSLHKSIYTTFFDYLKSAPATDTFVFKQASSDIYLLLEFFKTLEELEKQNQTS